MGIAIIAAMAKNRVIGKNNGMPWHLPADLRYFKKVTTGKPVVMGRKTFNSLNNKPLPGRKNIIITRDSDFTADNCVVVNSLDAALAIAKNEPEIMIIGGASIYQLALELECADTLYLTVIDEEFKGDTFFPEFDSAKWKEVERQSFAPDQENKYGYDFVVYKKH